MGSKRNTNRQDGLSAVWEADDVEDFLEIEQDGKAASMEGTRQAAQASKAAFAVGVERFGQADRAGNAEFAVGAEEATVSEQAEPAAESRFLSSKKTADETQSEKSLRPKSLDEYLGQSRIKDNLGVLIAAAKQREETLDHLLLSGPPGLGKTTLAGVVANELGVNFKQTSGSVIERPGDLAAILTNLEEEDVLFIDEIHRLNKVVEEVLYPAMEDFALDIVVGQGPSARSIRLDLPHFTLIAATTRTGLLTGPLRDRFGVSFHLDYYTNEELCSIVMRSAKIMKVDISPAGVDEIAARSRATPRLANRLLKRVRDYAQVRAGGKITKKVADEALTFFKVDSLGLDSMDNAILQLLVTTFEGKPVGLNTIASALGEESDTIADVYEPYLLRQGLIARTARGRQATRKTYEHLGVEYLQNE